MNHVSVTMLVVAMSTAVLIRTAIFTTFYARMTVIETWGLVYLVGHRHFGCTSMVGFGCSVHLLDAGWPIGCVFIVACCIGLGGSYMGWHPLYEGMVFRTLLTFFSVNTVSLRVGEGDILCCAMVKIRSTLVLLVVVPTNNKEGFYDHQWCQTQRSNWLLGRSNIRVLTCIQGNNRPNGK